MNYKKHTFNVLKAFESGVLGIDVAAKQIKKMLNKWGREISKKLADDRELLVTLLASHPVIALTAYVVVVDENSAEVHFLANSTAVPSLDALNMMHKKLSFVIENYETLNVVIKEGETKELKL